MPTPTPRRATIALLTLALATPAMVQGQTRESRPASKPAPKAPATPKAPAAAEPVKGTTVEFGETPFRLNSVGLTMSLPAGAVAQITGTGDRAAAQVMDQSKTWLIDIQTPQSKNLETGPEAVATQVLTQLLGSVGILDRRVDKDGKVTEHVRSTTGTIIEPVKAVVFAGRPTEEQLPAARFYVRLPRGDGQPAVVRGYTIFQTGPGKFVTFDLSTPEPAFQASRAVYETCVATARFADPAALSAARATAVETGIELLNSLTPADYEGACAVLKDQWYRLSKPAPGGSDADATEIAYRRVRAHKGYRGELDPMRLNPRGVDAIQPDSKWSAADRQQGYVVRIDARFLQEGKVVDSVGVYFMTPDRREEAWSLQMVIRDPAARKPSIWRELGARVGTGMRVTTDGSQETKNAQPTVPPRGYINQVEAFLLPQLLVRRSQPDSQGRAGDYGFYSYQSEFGNVRLRRDTLAEPQDRAGAWLVTTRLNEDRDPQLSIYNERGDLIKASLPDGSQWTPIALQRLGELWRTKGLPMD